MLSSIGLSWDGRVAIDRVSLRVLRSRGPSTGSRRYNDRPTDAAATAEEGSSEPPAARVIDVLFRGQTNVPRMTSISSWSFRGPSTAGTPRLAGLPGVRHQKLEPVRVLEAERYDTENRRLAAAGISLEMRRGDGPPYWQFDLRDEDSADQSRVPAVEGLSGPPAELDDRLHGVVGGRPVRPVATVRTVRTTVWLGDDESLLAEVVHDRVTIMTLGRATEVDSWTQVELRVADGGDEELVEVLADRFAEVGLGRGELRAVGAELDRRLGMASGARRCAVAAGPKRSAGAVVMAYVAEQVHRVAREELRLRRGEPHAVHRMRVASRRLRCALTVYGPLLDRTVTDPIVDGLRRLCRTLAAARHAEGLHDRITDGVADLEPELLLGPAHAQATRYLARMHAEVREAVLSELDGERFAVLQAAVVALVECPPLTARAAKPARAALPPLARRSARRLERAIAAAAGGPGGPADRDDALRAVRKRARRLRYASEVARSAVGKPAKRSARGLRSVQLALGEYRDASAARGTLRELGALAHGSGENGFSFGVLLGRDAARSANFLDKLPVMWTVARSSMHTGWLR